jgi:hypothetical protein
VLSIERRNPNLTVEYKTQLKKLPKESATVPGKLDALTERIGHPSQTRQFDIVVLGVGMASERTDVPFHATAPKGPRFIGIPFWMRDDFELPNFGLSTPPVHPVLVSGGGDGALQDYIRLVTGNRCALELLDKVLSGAGWSRAQHRIDVLQLMEAEQEVERALQWNETAGQDHDRLSALHNRHRFVVKRWRTSTAWSSIEAVLGKEMSGRPFGRVFLVHNCNHFSSCYGLNRFVALLIDEVVTSTIGRSGIKAGYRLRAARPPSARPHACSPNCWGPEHEVEIEAAPTCFSTPGAVTGRILLSGLVVRHGINKHTSAAWSRHILPRNLV